MNEYERRATGIDHHKQREPIKPMSNWVVDYPVLFTTIAAILGGCAVGVLIAYMLR